MVILCFYLLINSDILSTANILLAGIAFDHTMADLRKMILRQNDSDSTPAESRIILAPPPSCL